MKKITVTAAGRILRFLPAVIVMAAIFYFSAQTAEQSTAVSDAVVSSAYGEESVGKELPTIIVRKSAHFLEYAALGAALFFGFSGTVRGNGRAVAASVIFGGLYAASDELHQYFVPGRACMAQDVLLDTAGAAFGAAALLWVCILINKARADRKTSATDN